MVPRVGHQQPLPVPAEGQRRGPVQLVQLMPPAPEEQLPLALAAAPAQQPVVEGVGDQQGTTALFWKIKGGKSEMDGKSVEMR